MWRTNSTLNIVICQSLNTKTRNNNVISFTMASRSGKSSYDPYDLSSGDEEYLKSNNVAKTTHGQIDRSPSLLTATRLYLNSPPELPHSWGQINPNLNDYHSNPMEISSSSWLLDITAWCGPQEITHSSYADLYSVARNIFFKIPHGVRVEGSFSLRRDVICWRQSETTLKTLCEMCRSKARHLSQ
jgi:hypothetical protein